MSNRNLIILAAVLIGGWLFFQHQAMSGELPWNKGQAGSIFSGLQGGGGQ
jgi:hypothetical protein